MIDVGDKKITKRKAVAEGFIIVAPEVIDKIKNNKVPKGNVFDFAESAGLFAIKNTPYTIPHCHPVKITKAKINFEIENDKIRVICEVEGIDRTGFEMEALYGVCVSLLTIYDMCKGFKKEMKITDIKLLSKQK
ncbi:MAG TPA: cyclic pyranopterin monophosphate synthase MoaC [bacterium]|nr:cyclic pyranopterin monophosphate synthase MoaC [bacterium]HOM27197.1 cyclic pyranopterin monophosphate synthase MoaC [bacterium]